MSVRLVSVGVILVVASSARANGAMGLALEMFDLSYWFAYVGVTIVLEAWLIGRYLKVPFGKSLVISTIANTITGVMCGGLGCFAPFLHQAFIGSTANPMPFPNAVALLSAFAIPSAIVEKVIWERVQPKEKYWKSYLHIIGVHLLTIPVGLGILLIPERPYRGLEAFARGGSNRSAREAQKALESYIAANRKLPSSLSPGDILRELQPFTEFPLPESMWYETDFTRFGVGRDRNRPFQINKALIGKRIPEPKEDAEPNYIWYVRNEDGRRSLSVDVNLGQVISH